MCILANTTIPYASIVLYWGQMQKPSNHNFKAFWNQPNYIFNTDSDNLGKAKADSLAVWTRQLDQERLVKTLLRWRKSSKWGQTWIGWGSSLPQPFPRLALPHAEAEKSEAERQEVQTTKDTAGFAWLHWLICHWPVITTLLLVLNFKTH